MTRFQRDSFVLAAVFFLIAGCSHETHILKSQAPSSAAKKISADSVLDQALQTHPQNFPAGSPVQTAKKPASVEDAVSLAIVNQNQTADSEQIQQNVREQFLQPPLKDTAAAQTR